MFTQKELKEAFPPNRSIVKTPIAWGCKTCNKIDWVDTKEQLAKPEHLSYRGVDIGTCKGKFIPLFDK